MCIRAGIDRRENSGLFPLAERHRHIFRSGAESRRKKKTTLAGGPTTVGLMKLRWCQTARRVGWGEASVALAARAVRDCRAQGRAGISDFEVAMTDFIHRFCLRAILTAPATRVLRCSGNNLPG